MESAVHYSHARPCARLGASVARFWEIQTACVPGIQPGPGRWALPDGGSEWVFVLGGPLRRAGVVHATGAHVAGTAPSAYQSGPVGEMLTFGITFPPGGARAFLPVPAHQLLGQTIALDEVWDHGARDLVEKLAEADDFAARVALVQDALLRRWRPPDGEVAAALRRLRAEPGLPIGTLAGDAATARRLERKFLRDVGVPPKRLARMFRLQHAVRLWLVGAERSPADLALRAGYTDQSHMVHEFRDLAGAPPRHVLERERGMSDSYKTAPG